MLKREIQRLFASFLYFSRITAPGAAKLTDQHFQKALRYLPWVGLVVSIVGALVMYYSVYILPKPVSLLLGMLTTVILTGAIHEDGLADACDGFGGGYTKQRILDIMKDSHIGTYGVMGFIFSFLFRFIALSEMPRFFMAVFFVAGNTLSRYTLLTLIYRFPYARNEEASKSKYVIGSINLTDLIIAGIPIFIIFYFTNNITALLLIIPVWIAKWLLGSYFNRKIGGYTGDCLGATQQITEVVFYLAALVWLKFTW